MFDGGGGGIITLTNNSRKYVQTLTVGQTKLTICLAAFLPGTGWVLAPNGGFLDSKAAGSAGVGRCGALPVSGRPTPARRPPRTACRFIRAPNGAACRAPRFSRYMATTPPTVLRERCRIRHDPVRFTRPAGEGKSARGAPASARLRNATRCCTGAASPRRSFRCAFGSARRPRCRPGRGSRASPPTD